LLNKSDDEVAEELSNDNIFVSVSCPVYSLLKKGKHGYFENLMTTLVKMNYPKSLEAFLKRDQNYFNIQENDPLTFIND
jgi:hypothetical protein